MNFDHLVLNAIWIESPENWILTIDRGKSVGLPICEVRDGESDRDCVARALAGRAAIRNIGTVITVACKERIKIAYCGIEVCSPLFFYQLIGASIVPISSGTAWEDITPNYPYFDQTIAALRAIKAAHAAGRAA